MSRRSTGHSGSGGGAEGTGTEKRSAARRKEALPSPVSKKAQPSLLPCGNGVAG